MLAEMEVYTMKETADYLKISVESLRTLIKRKEIPYARVGNQYRFPKKVLLLWLQNRCVKNLKNNSYDQEALADSLKETQLESDSLELLLDEEEVYL